MNIEKTENYGSDFFATRKPQYYAIEFFNANEWVFDDDSILTEEYVKKWFWRSYPLYHLSRDQYLQREMYWVQCVMRFWRGDNLLF